MPSIESDVLSSGSGHSAAQNRTLMYHIFSLIFGFLAIVVASYVLTHAATTLTDEFAISDVLFGVIFLSIATTLPEKFIAVLSGSRGQRGILVANTVGSNIFLLSLCLGILLLSTGGEFNGDAINGVELGVMWFSTLTMTATVWYGGNWTRGIGGTMLVGYLMFLTLECVTRIS